MNGVTMYTRPPPPVGDLAWQLAAIADSNGDGQTDFIWRHTSTGENSVWHMAGTTILSGAFPAVTDTRWNNIPAFAGPDKVRPTCLCGWRRRRATMGARYFANWSSHGRWSPTSPSATHSRRALRIRLTVCAGIGWWPVVALMAQQQRALPEPFATPSTRNQSSVVPKPDGTDLKVPAGFNISLFADNMPQARMMVWAPNGDLFVAQSRAGTITVMRGGSPDMRSEYATGLQNPFGLAFQNGYLYVGETTRISRIKYQPGDTKASGAAEKLVDLPGGGHSTRNIAFSADGKKMYVAVGSMSNKSAGEEPVRAAINEYNPDGTGHRIFASGHSQSRGPCVAAGHQHALDGGERARHARRRPGARLHHVGEGRRLLRMAVLVHRQPSRSRARRQDAGSRETRDRPGCARSRRTPPPSASRSTPGHSSRSATATARSSDCTARGIARSRRATRWRLCRFANGKPSGAPEDFVTGWHLSDTPNTAWGRPVGVTVAKDGALLVADDGGGKIWRVSYGK